MPPGMNVPDHMKPAPVEVQESGYSWNQSGAEIEVCVRLPKAATKADLKVVFGVSKLVVKVSGEAVLDGKLAGKVCPDDCTWTLRNDPDGKKLMIYLEADGGGKWASLIQA